MLNTQIPENMALALNPIFKTVGSLTVLLRETVSFTKTEHAPVWAFLRIYWSNVKYLWINMNYATFGFLASKIICQIQF